MKVNKQHFSRHSTNSIKRTIKQHFPIYSILLIIIGYYLLKIWFGFSNKQASGLIVIIIIGIFLYISFFDHPKEFIPHYFEIELNILEILKKTGLNEEEMEHLGFNSISEKDSYHIDDIRFYLFNNIGYSVLNHYNTGYLVFNHHEQRYHTHIKKLITLNNQTTNSKEDKPEIAFNYSLFYLRETKIGYEFGLLKGEINHRGLPSLGFDNEKNYKVLGILPYNIIHTNSKAQDSDFKIFNKYGLEYTSHSISNKYVTIHYGEL